MQTAVFFFLIFLFLFLCIIADFVEGSGESVVSGGYRAGLYRLNLITCYFANRDGVRERHVYTTDSGAVILSRKPFIFTFSPSILRSHIEKTVKGWIRVVYSLDSERECMCAWVGGWGWGWLGILISKQGFFFLLFYNHDFLNSCEIGFVCP